MAAVGGIYPAGRQEGIAGAVRVGGRGLIGFIAWALFYDLHHCQQEGPSPDNGICACANE